MRYLTLRKSTLIKFCTAVCIVAALFVVSLSVPAVDQTAAKTKKGRRKKKMSAQIINGKQVSANIKERIKKEVEYSMKRAIKSLFSLLSDIP